MRRRRVPNIVPPLVLSATFVGVVPVCALVSCGSSPTDQDVWIGGDVAADAFGWKDVKKPMGGDVAACCFGVADAMFDDVIDEPIDDASDAADADDVDGGADSGRDG